MAPSTHGKVWWRNGYACGCMIASIEDIIEPRLRAAGYLGASEKVNVFQYAYNSSVGASAGTHSGGGALDHQKGSDGETKIWRECGVADWQRGTPEDTAFDDHNHGIWQGCPHLSGDAEGQITQYKQGCNGLADWGADQSPNVAPISWQDAYDKFIGSTGGLFGMSDIEKPHRTKDQKITDNGEWRLVNIDDDDGLSLLTGPQDLYVASVHWAIADLEVGAVAQFRLVVQDDDTSSSDKPTVTEYEYPIAESIGTSGSTYGGLHWTNNLGGDKSNNVKRRLRLVCKPPAGKTMTISDVECRVAH